MDKHIRRLDDDLRKFNDELQQEQLHQKTQAEQVSWLLIHHAHAQVLKAKGKQKGQRNPVEEEIIKNAPKDAYADMDMPIDPNEPVYCVCKQVSFGEMVACDNPQVIQFYNIT